MYFPESQIVTNLYTNGGELMYISSNQEYIGYYFKTLSGQYYTGKNQNDGFNQLLVPIVTINTVLSPLDSNLNYVRVIGGSLSNTVLKYLPYYLPQLPTQEDYQISEFRRYFCKKVNQIQYIEINQTQFDLLLNQDPQIEFSLYYPFFIDWQLTGDKSKVAEVNRNITLLAMKNQKLPSFDQYLKFDFTKYYQ